MIRMNGFSLRLGLRAILSLLSVTALLPAAADVATIQSSGLAVELDTKFPRVVAYHLSAGGQSLAGQPSPVSVIEVNGTAEPCDVVFKKSAGDSAEYRLAFAKSRIMAVIGVNVRDGVVGLRLKSVTGAGADAFHTLAMPGNALLSLSAASPDTVVSTLRSTGNSEIAENLEKPLQAMPTGADTGNYLFASDGKVAVGLRGNHFTDIRRVTWTVTEQSGMKTLAAQNPVWQYREIAGETVELPWVQVFVTADSNGDGKVNWQDAALVCRRSGPRPAGSRFAREMVADQISMNFASGAQQPFLKTLDDIKRAYLATDGLGQQITLKGFSSEGHDSANTDYAGHWNERAGGLRDLRLLMERAGEFNARIGIHINATEAYPEANRYLPEILKQAGGWYWLDHSTLIDKRKDVLSGQLFASLDAMRRDLPKLDFVYVDVYMDNGWPAWKLASKLNALGLPLHTEYGTALDPWSVWAHWRSKSKIMQFLRYNDADICEADPILRGGRNDHDGFLGWQNCHKFSEFVTGTFTRNLPAKYLKNFELLSFEPGKQAVFASEVRAIKSGDEVRVTENGRLVMTWTGSGANSRLLIPWPATKCEKLYAWDALGASQTWELPPAWAKLSSVHLYRLTDRGRAAEGTIPVSGGKVTLALAKDTPYVIYAKAAPAQRALTWGEGSPVANPGFDGYDLQGWTLSPAGAPQARVEADRSGNPRLVVSGNSGAGVSASQTLEGLKPGQLYAATAWALVKGERQAELEIACGKAGKEMVSAAAYIPTSLRHSAPCDPRTGTSYERLRVVFKAPADGGAVRLSLKAGSGAADSVAEFDDLRVVATAVSPEAAKHTFWEDFENVESGGYGVFTGCQDEYTHLSETHAPYTKDTIAGRFSLKTRGKNFIARTQPNTLKFAPDTRYRFSCETLTDSVTGKGRFVFNTKGRRPVEFAIPGGRHTVTGEFSTGPDAFSTLALYKDAGDALVIDNLAIDAIGPASPPALEDLPTADKATTGRALLLEEAFPEKLDAAWKIHQSRKFPAKIRPGDGLVIEAAAHATACVERAMPRGTRVVEALVSAEGEQSYTWGTGIWLLWPGGQSLRINIRSAAGCFGVDSTEQPQITGGRYAEGVPVLLRLRIEADKVFAEAQGEAEGELQVIASFPAEKFPGEPATLRVGKSHGVEGLDDNSDGGSEGRSRVRQLRVFGAKQ